MGSAEAAKRGYRTCPSHKKEITMKIIMLKAQNIKNLKAVEIAPEGNVVRLTGANGAGKSAVLDTIFTALTGKRLEDPIRRGEERAEVVIDMGDFKVRKIWTVKGERLEVLTADGDQKKSPQAFLDEIIGRLSFDPLGFKNMKPTEQRDLLKMLVGLDFADIDAEKQGVYDERTVLNSHIKAALAQLKTIEPPDPQTPDEEMTFKDELEKLNQLREKRNAYLKAVSHKNDRIEYIAEVEGEIEAIKIQIENLQKELKENEEQITVLKAGINQIVIPPAVTEAQIKEVELALEDIETKNTAIRAAKRYRSCVKDGEKLKKESDALSERLERLEQDKATRIANAQFPIEGLSMSDDDVIYNGIPFSRLSTGQQIRVSTAIAMRLNPSLKVILVREGSLLDQEGKKELITMAKDKDYQVWMEEVDETGKVGFFIEDGTIAKIDGQEVDNASADNHIKSAV